MIKAVFFDLDGTLLPMDENQFTNYYFGLLCKKVIPLGYDKDLLIDTIWAGTKCMYKNDGQKSNEEVFWDYFKTVYGEAKMADKPIFDSFYSNEFKGAKAVCGDNPYAREIVDFCNNNFQYTILSTNPIFPHPGTVSRMGFIGLEFRDFDFVTTYENSNYSKASPMYFKWLLEKFNLKPEEVILFGNNDYEDYYMAKVNGIKCYLVGDYIIHNEKITDNITKIKLEDIIPTLKKEMTE